MPHDHARAIRCLQDNQQRPTFGQACRDELVQHEEHAAVDYRCAVQSVLQLICVADVQASTLRELTKEAGY